ncbi:hypothetical protein HK253_09975, partial [Streptococcus agalactiae]|nr:hypothetical protein [Streptococcus agalactiae]
MAPFTTQAQGLYDKFKGKVVLTNTDIALIKEEIRNLDFAIQVAKTPLLDTRTDEEFKADEAKAEAERLAANLAKEKTEAIARINSMSSLSQEEKEQFIKEVETENDGLKIAALIQNVQNLNHQAEVKNGTFVEPTALTAQEKALPIYKDSVNNVQFAMLAAGDGASNLGQDVSQQLNITKLEFTDSKATYNLDHGESTGVDIQFSSGKVNAGDTFTISLSNSLNLNGVTDSQVTVPELKNQTGVVVASGTYNRETGKII